jgi:xylulokinase
MKSKDKDAENYVIGLDCSTTSIKAILFNKAGKVVAHASEPIFLHSPQPNYYEQDPEDWWISAQKAISKVTAQIGPSKILALAISNQRETFVALDKNGNPLRPAIIWLDERCKDEVESFADRVGHKKIRTITGKPVDYAPVVYRLAWMKKMSRSYLEKLE